MFRIARQADRWPWSPPVCRTLHSRSSALPWLVPRCYGLPGITPRSLFQKAGTLCGNVFGSNDFCDHKTNKNNLTDPV